jgi:hypothetical protein
MTPHTPLLFDDLPLATRAVQRRAEYAPCNPAMRTARDYCNAMLAASDPARRAQCYRLMIDAITAKDGLA